MGGTEDVLSARAGARAPSGLLSRLGLGSRELWAWALYDCANSAFWTTVIVAVFPPFFSGYAAAGMTAAEATERFAWATTIAVTVVALMAPVLGAIADLRAMKKRLLAAFMAAGVLATLLMATVGRGEWVYAAILFVAGNIAVAATLVFYDSLLPHIAPPEDLDRVSTAGFAIGFLGGGVLLLVNLAWILSPGTFGLPDAIAAVKLSFASVAVWWFAFSLPLLRRVPEPPAAEAVAAAAGRSVAALAFVQTWRTFGELRLRRDAFLMLVAFLLYNDGIQTIIRMASIYATQVGIDTNAQVAAYALVQFIGVPCSFLFGAAAGRIGAKRALYGALGVYVVITVLGYYMRTTWHFYAIACLVGVVQGGSQALSRSLFARMIPKKKSSEYFGFFAVFEKFAGIFGPALFALSLTLFGSSRAAILSVIPFFVAGGLVLVRVNVARGEAEAAAVTHA